MLEIKIPISYQLIRFCGRPAARRLAAGTEREFVRLPIVLHETVNVGAVPRCGLVGQDGSYLDPDRRHGIAPCRCLKKDDGNAGSDKQTHASSPTFQEQP